MVNNKLISLLGHVLTWVSTLLLNIAYGKFLGNVKFGELNHTEVVNYLSMVDVGLIPDPQNGLNEFSTMLQTMEYMVMGKLVIAFDLTETRYSAQDGALYGVPNLVSDLANKAAIRLDSSWRGEAMIIWLLERGYQVTGKFKSSGRVRKLVGEITTWSPTSSPGREVAPVPKPVSFVRPLQQYAVRTPSKEHASGYYHAVVFTSRTDLSKTGVVEQYDERAGMEADLKSDKHGLGLAVIRKQRLHAKKIVVLLILLAHNLLLLTHSKVPQGMGTSIGGTRPY